MMSAGTRNPGLLLSQPAGTTRISCQLGTDDDRCRRHTGRDGPGRINLNHYGHGRVARHGSGRAGGPIWPTATTRSLRSRVRVHNPAACAAAAVAGPGPASRAAAADGS